MLNSSRKTERVLAWDLPTTQHRPST